MATDPFALVHSTFTAFLLSKPRVKKHIRGNFEDYLTSRGGKRPPKLMPSDLPWLNLHPTGGQATAGQASDLATWDMSFEVQIISGDQRFNSELYPATAALYAACVAAEREKGTTIRQVRWDFEPDPDWHIIRDLDVDSLAVGLYRPLDADGLPQEIKGCTSVCSVTLHTQFKEATWIEWANSQT